MDSLLYTYTDYQGSLLALTDANGNVVQRYAYDPWGKRRNPNNWTQGDSRTSFLINRGYTGHEHLDAFGIINMNGRVYDPLTASFFSPDPYLQAPGNWLNYNRYAYAYGNPFKYTDPDGEYFFYIIPSVSYSPNGGWNFGLSAGIGIPGGLSAGVSIGYSAKGNSWSFTGNASFAGFYGYGGYDTKAGWIAGWGAGFGGLYGIGSNLTSVGVNWSQNGGWSQNWFGFQISENGAGFDLSVSASYTMQTGEYGTSDVLASDIEGAESGSPVGYSTESAQAFINANENLSADGLVNLYADGRLPSDKYSYKNGKVLNKHSKEVYGVTKFNGKKHFFWGERQSDVYLYKNAFRNKQDLYLTIGHEFVHVNLNYQGFRNIDRQESTAYLWQDAQYRAWGYPADNVYYDAARQYNYMNPYSSVFGPKIIYHRPW